MLKDWLTYIPLLYVMSAGLVFSMRSCGWLMVVAITTLAAAAFLFSAFERGDSDVGWLGVTAAIIIAAGVVIGAAARGVRLLMPTRPALAQAISILLLASPPIFIWIAR